MVRLITPNRFWMLLSILSLSVSTVTAQQFPYVAYITSDQAYVRSGPSQRYYPTGQIPQGFAVEVYRHDGDGWCAVRPPEGSYSLVPSHQVRTVAAGVVEIIEDNVVTRVGSSLAPDRSAVQVLLPKGEQLEVMPASPTDDPRWVRIAAPAGEFRWIAANDLSRQPPMEVTPTSETPSSGWTRQNPHAYSNNDEPNAFNHLNQAVNDNPTGLQFGTPTLLPKNEPAKLMTKDPNEMEIVEGSPAQLQLTQFQSQALGTSPPSLLGDGPQTSALNPAQPRVRFHGLTPTTMIKVGSVEELELRLSQAVVSQPQQWNLEPLEAAANDLLAETSTPAVRAQLREVLERIARFKEVQQRYNNPTPPTISERNPVASTPEATEEPRGLTGQSLNIRELARKDLATSPRARPQAARASTSSIDEPLYDAAGILKPVVSKREQAPQYALVDEKGKVVSFVTPTPDLNLQPYVGRRVGVNGTRGYMPEYRRAHVTAGRVSPIEGTVRR